MFRSLLGLLMLLDAGFSGFAGAEAWALDPATPEDAIRAWAWTRAGLPSREPAGPLQVTAAGNGVWELRWSDAERVDGRLFRTPNGYRAESTFSDNPKTVELPQDLVLRVIAHLNRLALPGDRPARAAPQDISLPLPIGFVPAQSAFQCAADWPEPVPGTRDRFRHTWLQVAAESFGVSGNDDSGLVSGRAHATRPDRGASARLANARCLQLYRPNQVSDPTFLRQLRCVAAFGSVPAQPEVEEGSQAFALDPVLHGSFEARGHNDLSMIRWMVECVGGRLPFQTNAGMGGALDWDRLFLVGRVPEAWAELMNTSRAMRQAIRALPELAAWDPSRGEEAGFWLYLLAVEDFSGRFGDRLAEIRDQTPSKSALDLWLQVSELMTTAFSDPAVLGSAPVSARAACAQALTTCR